MRVATFIMLAAAGLAGACGGGGTATSPPPVNFPSAMGSWRGSLLGPAGETVATMSLTIEQSSDVPNGQASVGMQGISGRWNGTTPSLGVSGGFRGGVGPDGKLLFTFEPTGQPCNVHVEAQLSGNRISGIFFRTNQQGCTPWLPDPVSSRIELTRD